MPGCDNVGQKPIMAAHCSGGRLNSIVRFLPSPVVGRSFEPSDIEVMSRAYDRAIANIRGKTQPTVVLEVLAHRIIGLYCAGERDADAMSEKVLEGLGMPSD